MSASSSSAGPQGSQPLNIPRSLLELVAATREPCRFWGTKRGCRKGSHCKDLHGETNLAHLPHISRHGNFISLRPPLASAWDAFFAEKGVVRTVSEGRQWTCQGTGHTLITYQCVRMQQRDEQACIAAEQVSGVRFEKAWLGASSAQFSRVLMHGTGLDQALQILCDGAILPSPGIAGHGIYGFELASPNDQDALDAAWRRTCTGGYNWGAAFVLETRGVLVNGNSELQVPPGAVAKQKDQFAAAPASVAYRSVTFNLEALISALGKFLDQAPSLLYYKSHMEPRVELVGVVCCIN